MDEIKERGLVKPMWDYPLKGKRFCQICFLFSNQNHKDIKFPRIDIYSTVSLFSDSCLQMINLKQIATQNQANWAFLSGPRYWVVDGFLRGDERIIIEFDCLKTIQVATVPLTLHNYQKFLTFPPYTEWNIVQSAVCFYAKGQIVYKLVTPLNEEYIMQSFSQQIDNQLTFSMLSHLGPKLQLPFGWIYKVETLKKSFFGTSEENNTIFLQDDLQNVYQKCKSCSNTHQFHPPLPSLSQSAEGDEQEGTFYAMFRKLVLGLLWLFVESQKAKTSPVIIIAKKVVAITVKRKMVVVKEGVSLLVGCLLGLVLYLWL